LITSSNGRSIIKTQEGKFINSVSNLKQGEMERHPTMYIGLKLGLSLKNRISRYPIVCWACATVLWWSARAWLQSRFPWGLDNRTCARPISSCTWGKPLGCGNDSTSQCPDTPGKVDPSHRWHSTPRGIQRGNSSSATSIGKGAWCQYSVCRIQKRRTSPPEWVPEKRQANVERSIIINLICG